MDEFRADLHCHTNCSDGSMSPRELVFHAKEIGLSGLSITDHDTIDAYASAVAAAQEAGIALGSGVEFSSVDQNVSVHVLGYDIDLKHPELVAFCQKHIERRRDRNQRILEKLKSHNIPIDGTELEAQIAEGHPVGRPHIAMEMVKNGYVNTMQEAFNRFIGDGMPCFDPGIPITTDETLRLIHAVGGKAFIAHPHMMKDQKRARALLEKPFDGIECYYANCPPGKERRWVKLANEQGLLISGGSDFHGEMRRGISLGCSWVDKATFERIFQRKL